MIEIRYANPTDRAQVIALVSRLLRELGEEAEDVGAVDQRKLLREWGPMAETLTVLLAYSEQTCVGVLPLREGFAIYANGRFGTIEEMYVVPELRSCEVGAQLLSRAKEHAAARGWSRLDVTAPESDRWTRTRRFYESAGFTFAGPKLKFMFSS